MAANELSPEIQKIQETVVGMYSENPWPLNRRTDEEMGWRLKCLGIVPTEKMAALSSRCNSKRVGQHGRAKNRPIVRSFAFPGHGIMSVW